MRRSAKREAVKREALVGTVRRVTKPLLTWSAPRLDASEAGELLPNDSILVTKHISSKIHWMHYEIVSKHGVSYAEIDNFMAKTVST